MGTALPGGEVTLGAGIGNRTGGASTVNKLPCMPSSAGRKQTAAEMPKPDQYTAAGQAGPRYSAMLPAPEVRAITR